MSLQRVIDAACVEVRRAVAVSSDELEGAARQFALAVKARGLPIERALPVLLDCVAELRLSPPDREQLLRGAIDAYGQGE